MAGTPKTNTWRTGTLGLQDYFSALRAINIPMDRPNGYELVFPGGRRGELRDGSIVMDDEPTAALPSLRLANSNEWRGRLKGHVSITALGSSLAQAQAQAEKEEAEAATERAKEAQEEQKGRIKKLEDAIATVCQLLNNVTVKDEPDSKEIKKEPAN
eukprot:m51a1_g12952 hypothetical protein (157) ;mRNA; f:1290-2124